MLSSAAEVKEWRIRCRRAEAVLLAARIVSYRIT